MKPFLFILFFQKLDAGFRPSPAGSNYLKNCPIGYCVVLGFALNYHLDCECGERSKAKCESKNIRQIPQTEKSNRITSLWSRFHHNSSILSLYRSLFRKFSDQKMTRKVRTVYWNLFESWKIIHYLIWMNTVLSIGWICKLLICNEIIFLGQVQFHDLPSNH